MNAVPEHPLQPLPSLISFRGGIDHIALIIALGKLGSGSRPAPSQVTTGDY